MGLLKKEECGVFSSQDRKDYSLLSTERETKSYLGGKPLRRRLFLQKPPYASNSYNIQQ